MNSFIDSQTPLPDAPPLVKMCHWLGGGNVATVGVHGNPVELHLENSSVTNFHP